MAADKKILELHENGYCVLRAHLSRDLIDQCREAFWPVLVTYLKTTDMSRTAEAHHHFLPMPFEPPCFAPEFFFDLEVLTFVVWREAGCDGDIGIERVLKSDKPAMSPC